MCNLKNCSEERGFHSSTRPIQRRQRPGKASKIATTVAFIEVAKIVKIKRNAVERRGDSGVADNIVAGSIEFVGIRQAAAPTVVRRVLENSIKKHPTCSRYRITPHHNKSGLVHNDVRFRVEQGATMPPTPAVSPPQRLNRGDAHQETGSETSRGGQPCVRAALMDADGGATYKI